MRALELGDGHRLPLEAAACAGGGEVVGAHLLERHAASQGGVEGRPDGAHTPPRQLALQGVFPPIVRPSMDLGSVAEERNQGQSATVRPRRPAAPGRGS